MRPTVSPRPALLTARYFGYAVEERSCHERSGALPLCHSSEAQARSDANGQPATGSGHRPERRAFVPHEGGSALAPLSTSALNSATIVSSSAAKATGSASWSSHARPM
jgi:hypothetical protein